MRSIRTVAALLVLAFLLPSTVAATDAASCRTTTSSAVVTVGSGKAYSYTLYVVVTGADLDMVPVPWLYQEMNGLDGLQRQDALVDDTCGGRTMPDLLLW